jgi:pimeloyl-ACP methyl ester carboxylesterase
MSNDTHVSAPTRHVDAGGITFAYRRLGDERGVPLVFLQHFRGGLDHWDPLVTAGFAKDRPVILVDNAGVAGSSGETPDTIDAMADHIAAFVGAIELPAADILGFSMGGYVAQALALRNPSLARRLVLVGTGPRAGEPSQDPRIMQHAGKPVTSLDDFLFLFFAPSAAGQAAGRAFWERRHQRTLDVDPPSSEQAMRAQIASFMEWRQVRGERFAELKAIRQPTLVVNGSNDVMIPTVNAFTLQQHIPNAQLIIYPDSGHGSHFQYPELFLQHARLFLDS